MADLIIDVYQGSNRKCLAIGNHRISAGKSYGFLEKIESYKCDTKDILSCIGTVNRWIPCSERLPEKYTEVLAYSPFWGKIVVALWNGEYWLEQWTDDDLQSSEITHWMPLPEPPEVTQG